MAATTSSEALVLAWALEREMDGRPDSRQKGVILGLLALATTAVRLAHGLANNTTRDTLQDYYDIQDQMGLGIEAYEIAMAEAIDSFDDSDDIGAAPVPTASISASKGRMLPQPSEATNRLHPSELEPDIMAPETIIELIAGHVQTRLETTLLPMLVPPLINALIPPLTDRLAQPLTVALVQPLTLALSEPLATVLKQPLLDPLLVSLRGSLPKDGPLISDLVAALQRPLARQLSETLRHDLRNVFVPTRELYYTFTVHGDIVGPNACAALDPDATCLSGFSKLKDTPREDTQGKKRRRNLPSSWR